MRQLAAWVALVVVICGVSFFLSRRSSDRVSVPPAAPTPVEKQAASPARGGAVTNIYAHNLRLHQGPNFRVYVQWLRGQLVASRKGVTPSFDDPESFYLNVTNGVIHANIGDVCNYLNAQSTNAPLRNIKMSGTGNQVKITGSFHKVLTWPVELAGFLQPASGNRVQMHITKINVLKIPFKGLLGEFHVTLESMMAAGKIPGIEVTGNDIYFDPQLLLPPPHIRGTLTKVSMASPDLEAVYGNATKDVERTEEWRNFLRLRDGTINFGKLTMNNVDLMMIDISQDAWFDLDLANYQAQLVNGYTRMTPEAGLQIFMPDVSQLKDVKAQQIGIEWFKNRNVAPPAEVLPKQK